MRCNVARHRHCILGEAPLGSLYIEAMTVEVGSARYLAEDLVSGFNSSEGDRLAVSVACLT